MILSVQASRIWQGVFGVAVGLVLLATSTTVRAQSSITITAEAGFDAHYKDNSWVPLRITLENQGESIDGCIEAVITDNSNAVTTYIQPVSLPAGARKQLTLNLFLSYYTWDLKVNYHSADRVISSVKVRLNPLYSTETLYGVLSDHPSAYAQLSDVDPPNGSAFVTPLDIENLPEQAEAWESLDVVIIADADTGQLSNNQRKALEQWVGSGGQLLIIPGSQWQKTIAGLTDLLPFITQGSTSLSSLENLTAFSQSEVPLEISTTFQINRGTILDQAQVLVRQDNLPILIRQQRGYGSITLFTIDPAMEPLRSWDGMVEVYRKLFSGQARKPAWANGVINWNAAREAVGTVPNLTLPGTLSFMCFLGAYVVILGPLNYLILRKYKKREWAWITIPVIVLLFSLTAILVGNFYRGNKPILNRMAVILARPDTGQATISGVVGVYSPRPTTVDVIVGENTLLHSIYEENTLVQPHDRAYQVNGTKLTLPDLRVAAGETIPLIVDGSMASPSIPYDLSLEIDPSGVRMVGSLENNSQQTFIDAALLYPGGTISIGDFSPGEVRPISVALTQAEYQNPTPLLQTLYTQYGTYYPFFEQDYLGPDTTVRNIIGSNDYYNVQAYYRRFMLLNTHLVNNINPSRGSGIYLTGWTDSFPTEISLADQEARLVDTSLYIFLLTPDVEVSGDVWKLSPGIFTYSSPYDNPASSYGPYQFYIYNAGGYDWTFSLAYPLTYSDIYRLEINLTSSQADPYPKDLEVFLWDQQQLEWVQQDIGDWGSYTVPEPARYVNSTSEVQLRLIYLGEDALTINAADITLRVVP